MQNMRKPIIAAIFVSTLLSGNAFAQSANICNLITSKVGWADSLKSASMKHGVKASSILAFIEQESKFKANASNGGNFGYAQSSLQTWNNFTRSTGAGAKSRTDFDASVDFVGWNFKTMSRKIGIDKDNVQEQYLAYQMGEGGYLKRKNSVNRSVAKKVAMRAAIFEKQLSTCGLSL